MTIRVWSGGYASSSNIITVFAIARKMAPRPPSLLSRSDTNATALSIARRRMPLGTNGSTTPNSASRPAKAANATRDWCGALAHRRACGRPSGKSSSMCTPRGLRARGFKACKTSSGTSTVRLQYETRDK